MKTQRSNMRGAHRMKNAYTCHKWLFADFFVPLSFLKQQYKRMMPEPLQPHPGVCDFHALYAGFPSFQVPTEEFFWSSRCQCTFISKYLKVLFHSFQSKRAGFTMCSLLFVFSNQLFFEPNAIFLHSIKANSILKESDWPIPQSS